MNEIVEFGGIDFPGGTRLGTKIVYLFVTFGVIEVPLLRVTINYYKLGIERPDGSVI